MTRASGKGRSRVPRSAPRVRLGRPADLDAVVDLAATLWPEDPPADHANHMQAVLVGAPPSTLPLVVFVAAQGKRIVGFVEVGLRSHADGCDGRRPVGFVEGWFVARTHRRRGVGRRLIHAAERWAATKGCTEMASDTWQDNVESLRAHEGLGFTIVDRCVNFRKTIAATASRSRS